MLSRKLLRSNEKLIQIWNKFIEENELDQKNIRTIIAESWIRSKNAGVDQYLDEVKNELSKSEIEFLLKDMDYIISTAKPFMETLYKTVDDSSMIVRLTNPKGYVIECFGDEMVFNNFTELHLYRGTNVREDVIGTNAIGLVLKKKVPIQVLGTEHYRKCYHNWTTSAAPIVNRKGEIVAVLSMSGKYDLVHPHTLGMIMASALAIQNEIGIKKINRDLKRANEHLNAIMQSINEGIITISPNKIVTDVNDFALKFMKKDKEEILGTSIDNLITRNKFKHLISYGDSEELEIYFNSSGNSKRSVIVSVNSIYSKDNKISEYLLTFRESKKVYSQVNKILGSKAIYVLDDILGKSKEVSEAIRLSKLVAKSDVTIFLYGESGTGKELFAQGIHNESDRANNSFVFINCGAIPRDLVASELFGYEEGAFTGARKGGRPGKFELADGGTLFLDEIGDMPLDTQANLLRVLETKEVVRVGGNDVIPVDVRVIAATHKNLKEEVERGNFRSDLFYRLNVMPIHTPALRERKEDIKILIDNFYLQFSNNKSKKILIDESFYRVMKDYHWPGNVRELQNVMQMVSNIVRDNEKLSSEHLPEYMKESLGMKSTEVSTVVKPLYIIEKETIQNAIKITNGNLTQTAKLLEIGRTTLYRKLEKFNIKL